MSLESAIQIQGFKSEKDKVLVHVMYTAYQVKSAISRVLKDYALTPEQYNVLRILQGSRPRALCNRDIAERTIERNSNVPRIVDRLVVKKLVKRLDNPEDRRETLVQLTPAGVNLLKAATDALAAAQPTIVQLTEAEAASMNDLLEKMMPT